MLNATRAGRWTAPSILFGALSLTAVVIGCVVARASGAPTGEWARNLIAWIVGALLAGGLGRWPGQRVMAAALIATPLALAATLLSGGQAGVHRWVQMGPLRMNVAEVLLPVAVVATAAMASRPRLAWLAAALALGLLAAQPDASQATAFGGALVLIAWSSRAGRVRRFMGVGLVVLAVAASWMRRDPLGAVPEVEGIMGLAGALSWTAAVAAGAALAGAMLAPLAAARSTLTTPRTAAFALTAYGVLAALTPLAGAFPVPLVGMGMSPILGLWLGVGLLAALDRRSALTFTPSHAPFRAS